MSFLFGTNSPSADRPPSPARNGALSAGKETFYRELVEQRPTLLEEKLKLHARIIDEFNLTLLEKLPRAELVRQVRAYVADYVRNEKISLNQKELQVFSDEILDEMTGFG